MTGVIATIPRFQFSNAQGHPLASGLLFTHLAGTTSPATTYQDQALETANENPVQLDARGECVLWLDPSKSYKFVLKNALGVTQWTQDNVAGALASNRERPVETEIQTAGENQTLFTLKQLAYTPGINSLKVYVDGFRLSGAEYVETAHDTVTFKAGLRKDQEVLFETGSGVNSSSSNDAALIPYAAASSPANNVKQALDDLFLNGSATVTAKKFGAKADGIADDGSALADFFASAEDGFIGPGAYRISARTLQINSPRTIRGAGRGRTVLVFENMGGVLDAISVLSAGFPEGGALRLSDMTIMVRGSHARSGIVTSKGGDVFALAPSFHLERIDFRGDVEDAALGGLYDFGFVRALDIGDSTGSVLRDLRVFGSYDYRLAPGSANSTHAAFYFSGLAGQGGVLMPVVDHCFAHYCGRAVEYGYQVSQPHVINGQFHRVYAGIYSPIESAAGGVYGAMEALIHNMNINAQWRGISFAKSAFLDIGSVRITRANGGFDHPETWYGFYLDQVDELKMTGVRAYNEGMTYTNQHIGVYLNGGDYQKINGIHVYSGVAGGITKGVVWKDARFGELFGASFRNSTTAISFETASTASPEVSIAGTQFGPGITTKYSYGAGISKSLITIAEAMGGYRGVDGSAVSVSAAGAVTLLPGEDNQAKRYSCGAGAGAYTYDITLSNTNASIHNGFDFHVILTNGNPTVNIKDGGGTTIVSLNSGGSLKRYSVSMAFGTAWRCIRAVESLV